MCWTFFTQPLSYIPIWILQQKATTWQNPKSFVNRKPILHRPRLRSGRLGAGSAGRIQHGSRPRFRSGIGFGTGVRLAPWLLLNAARTNTLKVSKQRAKVGTEQFQLCGLLLYKNFWIAETIGGISLNRGIPHCWNIHFWCKSTMLDDLRAKKMIVLWVNNGTPLTWPICKSLCGFWQCFSLETENRRFCMFLPFLGMGWGEVGGGAGRDNNVRDATVQTSSLALAHALDATSTLHRRLHLHLHTYWMLRYRQAKSIWHWGENAIFSKHSELRRKGTQKSSKKRLACELSTSGEHHES